LPIIFKETTKPIDVKTIKVDYRMQYYDVIINPRRLKIVVSAYGISVKKNPFDAKLQISRPKR